MKIEELHPGINWDKLIPLRRPPASGRRANTTQSLLDHYQAANKNEPFLSPFSYDSYISGELIRLQAYNFFGQFVIIARQVFNSSVREQRNFFHAGPMKLSELAAHLLEQTFGRADSAEQAFVCPWQMEGAINHGHIFEDTAFNSIIAFGPSGIIYAQPGLDLIRAARVLPRVKAATESKIASGKLPATLKSIIVPATKNGGSYLEQNGTSAHLSLDLRPAVEQPTDDGSEITNAIEIVCLDWEKKRPPLTS